MKMRAFAVLAAVVIAAVSCSARTPEGGPTLSPSPAGTTPAPSESPKKPKAKLPSARYAVYASDGAIFLYDVKDDKVRELASGEAVRMPRWLNSNEISFLQGSERTFVRVLDIEGGTVRDLFSVSGGIDVYGWSPDRQTVAYVTTDDRDYPRIHYRSIAGSGATRTVATLARALGRGVSPDDQLRVEFSPDGEAVLIVYTYADGDGRAEVTDEATQLQVRGLDGSLLHGPKLENEPTMGFWAPDGKRVYYRNEAGARMWSVGAARAQRAPSRPRWYNPSPSRDGRFVAYDTGIGSAAVRVRVLDLRTGGIKVVSKQRRFHPVYASSRSIWVQRVRRCDDCLAPVEPAETVYAVDLRTGGERTLAIRSLVDVDVLYR